MSNAHVEFESSTERQAARKQRQQARQLVLDKARSEYEANEQERIRAIRRGEHMWMLPSVEAALDSESIQHEKIKKKSKKHKNKKRKKSKKYTEASCSSESSSDEIWIEKTAEGVREVKLPSEPVNFASVTPAEGDRESLRASSEGGSEQRRDLAEPLKDDWMKMSLFGTYSRAELREREGNSRVLARMKEKHKQPDKPGSHARELNPYYKDGGMGLPEDQATTVKAEIAVVGQSADWLKKALKRAKEQAKEDNVPLEEIATKRWGSLERFYEMLHAAEVRDCISDRINGNSKCVSSNYERLVNTNNERPRDDTRKHLSRHRSYCNSDDRKDDSSHRRTRHHSSSSSSSDSSSSRRGRKVREQIRNSRSRSRDRERATCRQNRERLSSVEQLEHRILSSSSRRSRNSPEVGARRLLRPPTSEDCGEGSSGFRFRSQQLAVWEDSRSLPSKIAAASGGWRKTALDSSACPKRGRRSSSRNSSDSSTTRSGDERTKTVQHSELSSTKESITEGSVDTISVDRPANLQENLEEISKKKSIKIYTENELNLLGAKIVKAELVGNKALAEKLIKKLQNARKETDEAIKAGFEPAAASGAKLKEEVVLLTTTNQRGVTVPLKSAEQVKCSKESKKRTKLSTTDVDNKRNKYFPDDDKWSLKQMFEREKLSNAAETDALFVRAAARAGRANLDEDYTLDDTFVDRSIAKEDTAAQSSRDRLQAIMNYKRQEKALSRCSLCLDSGKLQKHLIISLGRKSYVSLPEHQSLVEGHCLIVPREHVASSTIMDEDTWLEMKMFRNSLVQYFSSHDEDVVFLECCLSLNRWPHTVVHCLPIAKELGEVAPMYFKKAIQESEGEWTQNKKLVDLRGRDVRRAIPKELAYFAVDFGDSPGYAHVIEDESCFPIYFGQSIVGGMLDLEPQLWKKPRLEKFDEQRRKVLVFAKNYAPFDPKENNYSNKVML